MPDWLPAVVAGLVLLGLAAGSAGMQWRRWASGRALLPGDDEFRQHAWRMLRRRMQISVMLALVGMMIPLGDLLPVFRKSPRLFVIFWLLVLGLVVWMIVLALGDLASNLAWHRHARSELLAEKQSLEAEIRRYRALGGHRQNGTAPHDDQPAADN